MYTKSNDSVVYLGRNAGRSIHDSIKKAKKSVKIVSPFLTPQYIKELCHLREKDVDVTLITSDELEESKIYYRHGEHFSHHDVIKQNVKTDQEALLKRNKSITIATYLFIISFVVLIIGGFISIMYSLLFGGLGILIAIIWIKISFDIRIYFYSYVPLFKIRVFYSGKARQGGYLIHSKVYVIDDNTAFLGSANFTYTGFHKSYESVIQVNDKIAVKKISEEVDNLFNNPELSYRNIQEWGRQIYDEIPHEGSLIKVILNNLLHRY